jgi:copper homeostasis protein (lipoprotein)
MLLKRVRSQPDAQAASGPARRLRGMFTYMADAGRFQDCASGRSYPVAMEADNATLERAYSSARPEPGAPLLVTLVGRFEQRPRMEG